MRRKVENLNPKGKHSATDAVQVLCQMLDEALEDMEQGTVLSVEEAWKEIDAV